MSAELTPLHGRLNAAPGELEGLLQRARQIQAVQQACQRWSTEPWMASIRVANVRDGTLVVHSDSAAALTALRYRREALLGFLRDRYGWPLTRLEARVRPGRSKAGV